MTTAGGTITPSSGGSGVPDDHGAPGGTARRARLLLRWYPRSWRARYGDEFTELLLADLAERPRSWRRTADVARSGLLARLASAGLAGHPLDPAAAARSGLATLACSAAAFAVVGTAMSSQLAIGLQWSVPGNHDVTVAMDLMSGALLAFAVLALLAAIPVAWAAIAARSGRRARELLRPALLVMVGALILVGGGGISGTAGQERAATGGQRMAWFRAESPRSPGPPRCPSARTGHTRPCWPRSQPPSEPGWC